MLAASIVVEARPASLALRLRSTAIVVVDMQLDFAAPEGMFGWAGMNAGLLIVSLPMQFKEDLADLGTTNAPNRLRHLAMGVGQHVDAPGGTSRRVLVRDTWNTKIVDELAPRSGDLVIAKHPCSGFFEADLDDALCRRGTPVRGCVCRLYG